MGHTLLHDNVLQAEKYVYIYTHIHVPFVQVWEECGDHQCEEEAFNEEACVSGYPQQRCGGEEEEEKEGV